MPSRPSTRPSTRRPILRSKVMSPCFPGSIGSKPRSHGVTKLLAAPCGVSFARSVAHRPFLAGGARIDRELLASEEEHVGPDDRGTAVVDDAPPHLDAGRP